MASKLPPHAGRILHRIDGLAAPVIQLWSWPGTGKSAILAALAVRDRSIGLALGDLESTARLRDAFARARAVDARFAVLAAPPTVAVLKRAARWLPPGLSLVFGDPVRRELPLRTAIVAPRELLLDDREISALWAAETGVELSATERRRLLAATDGWLEPLRLAAAETQGVPPTGVDEMLRLPSVRDFLRLEVAPVYEGLGVGGWLRNAVFLAASGLALDADDGGEGRGPRLLAAWPERAGGEPPPVEVERRPRIDVDLFGQASIRRGGVEVRWPLRRAFQVVAYLASSPDLAAGRDELIDAIWAGESEADVGNNFHPTLSHLRRALARAAREPLPPPLVLRDEIYRLSGEIDWSIDWHRFFAEQSAGIAAASAEPERAAGHLRAAWSLYRGPFLPRLDAEWAALRRDRAEKAYADVLRTLGDLERRLGRPDEALDAYRALLAEDPLEERIHVEVMRLYAARGRRDLVRKQYDRLCTLLQEELGVDAMEATTREFRALMS